MRHTNLLLCALLAGTAFAGQSLVLTPSISGTSVVDPNLAQNQSWRLEFQIHNWTLPAPGSTNAKIFQLTGIGSNVFLYGDGRIALEDDRDAIAQQQPCFVSTVGITNALVRFQRDLSTMRAVCEIWNYDGTGYNSQTVNITSTNTWTSSGGSIGGGTTLSLGFLRVFTTLVAPGSRPPTTADGGNWTELKFDGNLNDASGHGHTASIPGASYMATPNQGVTAFPKTQGAPAWSTWTSLRAGYPSRLDGTASYSLADGSSSVSYLWRQVNGPTTVNWDDRTLATPTVSGLVFGSYGFSLKATDVAGNSAIGTLQAGAVAYDDNGVVISSDPNVPKIFGPQIAFGQNPWGWEDERNLYAVGAQTALWANAYDPTWATPGQGTISYPFSGKGFAPGGIPGTTITGAILATDTSIPIADASRLSLTSLPTWIFIGTAYNTVELIRICATTATSGPATLTVCYDGRGVSGNLDGRGDAYALPAQAWPSGTTVGEFRIQGTGTLFATDANRPICPAGVPGPQGAVKYSTGTLTLVAGSTTVVGSGSSWTNGNGVQPGGFIRVAATHASGISFVFWAQIVTVTDTTHLVLNRPAPTGVDATAFSYKITSPAMYLSLELMRQETTTLPVCYLTASDVSPRPQCSRW